jgi:RNA-directed DNA polymerase
MTLDGLEQILLKKFVRWNWNQNKVNLVRYADDFIITGASKEVLENEVKTLVAQFLTERGLSLSVEKTKVTHIEEGFDFLGFNLRKYRGKLLIKPAKGNVNSFLQGIRRIVKGNKMAKQVSLIRRLNPLIKGWANYYQHVVASKTFKRMDFEIWKTVWQWAKRRHPNKTHRWIKEKYFRSMNGSEWVFADETGERLSDGTPKLMPLHRLSNTKIQRHIKIRSEANPFDPQWETYFEERMVRKMKGSLKGRKRLLKMWTDQKGKCPVCKLYITEETEWHNHHLLPKHKGGKSIVSNLVLLHPDCHRKVHSLKLEVVKPALGKGLRKA